MKTYSIKSFIIICSLAFSLSSCGLNMGFLSDKNRTVTHVELNKGNYKVIDRVSGTSSATYYLGVGGMKNQALLDIAMTDLLSKANLTGGSKALVNQTVDVHKGGVPFIYSKITVKITAHVIEFTD
jgi:hypothetical protein